MVQKKTWKEFRETGMLWWINTILHTFGWAIVIEIDESGEISNAYPARVKFRGFDIKSTEKGYQNISKYMKDNAETLCDEANS